MTLGLTAPRHDPIAAHKHCTRNRSELEASPSCGCFYCLSIYSPVEIKEWVVDDKTAICARCPVDSVIGSASGYPITRAFLERMHEQWF